MKKHILQPKSSDIFIPISIAIILLIGIIISLVQVQQPQQNKSNAQTALKNCDVSEAELSLDSDEAAMFARINAYRKEKGLKELYYNQTLQRGAQWLSNDMAAHKNLDHTDSLGRDVGTRLKDCGLSEKSWGENIAEGYQTVDRAFDGWKNSPPHNANMLGDFSHMGIAIKNTFWSLNLAKVTNGPTSPPPTSGGSTPVPSVSGPTVTGPTSPVVTSPTVVPTVPTGQPDLIVSDMVIDTNGVTCGSFGLNITIKNQGGKTTLPVVVQGNTTIGTIGGGIDAGATKTIWLQSAVNGENTVRVDPSGAITEKDETNNILKKTLVVPTKPASCTLTPTTRVTTTGTPTGTRTGTPTGTSNATITPAPTDYPGFALNPNDTQVLVSIKLPGVGINGNKSPKHQSRKVAITVYSLENEPVFEGAGYLTYDKKDLFRGLVHLGKIPNGTYYIKVSSMYTLQELIMPQFQPLSNDRLNILSPAMLITGELNGDNQLTIADYNIALTCFQDKKCAAKPKTDANDDGAIDVYDAIDFNDDGKTDVVDYNYFLHNFREFGGD